MFLLHATHHIDTPVIKKEFFSITSMLQFHCSAYNVTYLLQRRMPWLEDRWRTQRTVLNISNCRFPRKKRILNALCELTSCQFTWLAVTAICSRSNSEVWVVFTCCRRLLRRHVRGIQRASRFRAALWLRLWCSNSGTCSFVWFPNIFSTHAHDQSRDYPLNLSI